MSIYGKGIRGKATKLHAQKVRERGFCQNCGRTPPEIRLECAHIISRRYAATRCLLNNAFALCSGCHRYFTEWPLEFHDFVIRQIGADAYDDLRALANAGVKTNDAFWQDQIDRLEAA